VNILFIDDEFKDYPIIENLEEAGWSVNAVKDVRNVNCEAVERAQIVFVDYKGVGSNFSQNEQGIAIIKQIKKTYGDKKRTILYSAHNTFSLGDSINAADSYLRKNVDTIEFLERIQDEMGKLK